MRIAFITPEFQSLVRRTNLATVSESLAKALHGARQDVRVFLPWAKELDTSSLGALTHRVDLQVPDGRLTQRVRVHEGALDGVPVYLFEHEHFFGSRHPYGDQDGPYPDNWRRYALFSRAVLDSMEHLGFSPDVLHCLDWTTGLIPLLHRLEWVEAKPDHPTSKAGTYFAIHNLAMQGVFEREILPHIGLPHEVFRYVEGLELGAKVNFMKAGAEFATIVGTYSPGHAKRIQELDRGYGLEDTFQRRHKELLGITNGIDYEAWDPATDSLLPARFNGPKGDLAGKKKCKAALQAALKLDNGPRQPIAISIGRWDADSGFDLVADCMTEILERNFEVIVMGQGSPEMNQRLLTWERSFVGRMRAVEGYNQHTAHMMMAGADLLLLPAHYQPANPLIAIAMRYGVLPVVYAKSGLEDSVIDYPSDKSHGTGFQFEPYTSEGLMESITAALATYREANKWKLIVKRALGKDFSWDATAAEYLKAYRRVTRRAKQRLASA